jgi:hypothetical protein
MQAGYMVVVEVRLREPVRDVAGSAIAGYFRSIGVNAGSPEEAAAIAGRVAVEPDGASGWQPPPTCEIGEVEVNRADGHDTSVADLDGVFFRGGRVFYPPKRWWEFWK